MSIELKMTFTCPNGVDMEECWRIAGQLDEQFKLSIAMRVGHPPTEITQVDVNPGVEPYDEPPVQITATHRDHREVAVPRASADRAYREYQGERAPRINPAPSVSRASF
jgi:hypothetical protein